MRRALVAIGIANAPQMLYKAICLLPTFKMNLRPEKFLLMTRLFRLPSSECAAILTDLVIGQPKVRTGKDRGYETWRTYMTFIRVILSVSPVDGKKSFTHSLISQTIG